MAFNMVPAEMSERSSSTLSGHLSLGLKDCSSATCFMWASHRAPWGTWSYTPGGSHSLLQKTRRLPWEELGRAVLAFAEARAAELVDNPREA